MRGASGEELTRINDARETVSLGARGDLRSLTIERVEGVPDAAGDTGEDGCVAQSVGARLAASQLLHQIEEVAGVIRLERDHELLVVEPERVSRVDRDRRVLPADLDVLAHDPHPLRARQAVPVPDLPERIDEEVL